MVVVLGQSWDLFLPKIDIWNVPYLFRDDNWLNEVLNGPYRERSIAGTGRNKVKGVRVDVDMVPGDWETLSDLSISLGTLRGSK